MNQDPITGGVMPTQNNTAGGPSNTNESNSIFTGGSATNIAPSTPNVSNPVGVPNVASATGNPVAFGGAAIPAGGIASSASSGVASANASTTKEITKRIITHWLIWYVIFSIIYSCANNLLASFMGASLGLMIISIILHASAVFGSWRMGVKFAFKDRQIRQSDIKKLMKNLTIFTAIVCATNMAYQFIKVNEVLNQTVESDYSLKAIDKMAERSFGEQEMSAYNQQKNELIEEMKGQVYIRLAILELCYLVIFFGAIPLVKKMIAKYAISDGGNLAPTPMSNMSSPTPPTATPMSVPPVGRA